MSGATTDLVSSVGVAANTFLAKLASDHGKPDGFVILRPEQAALFWTLLVARIWGVGKKSERRLHALGLRTIGELAALPERVLASHFGASGRHLWRLTHGQDDREVVPDREAMSLSTEATFLQDVGDRQVLRAWLLDLTECLAARLRQGRGSASCPGEPGIPKTNNLRNQGGRPDGRPSVPG
jgi:DNA polymerase-4